MRLLLCTALCAVLLCGTANAQLRASSLIITANGGTVRLNPPASGNQQFTFPLAPSGSVFILSDANSEQSIAGGLNIVGTNPLKIGGVAGTDGKYLGVSGGVLGWYTPSGGGGASTSTANSWTEDQTFLTTSTQGGLFMSTLNASTTALDVNSGGTGQTSYTNGQLLIGNSTGNTLTKATLTAGAGVTVTNGEGSITLASAPISISGTATNMSSTMNTTFYYHPGTFTAGGNVLQNFSRMRVPRSGVIRNFYVELSVAPGLGDSRSFTIRNVTTGVALTAVTITDDNTSGNTGAATLTVSEGDMIRLEQLPVNIPASGSAIWSFEIY